MKKGNRILLAVFIVFLLTGCGKTETEMTTIEVQKNGQIEHTIIEEFGEADASALQGMVEGKASAYNGSGASSGEAKVLSVELKDGTAKVVMTYPDAETFAGFMNMDVAAVDSALSLPFFDGTVEKAYMLGYDLEVVLQGAEKEGTLQGKNDLLARGSDRLIIYDNGMNLGAPVQIKLPKKPLYISDNVTVTGKKLVEVSGAEKPAYILMKK